MDVEEVARRAIESAEKQRRARADGEARISKKVDDDLNWCEAVLLDRLRRGFDGVEVSPGSLRCTDYLYTRNISYTVSWTGKVTIWPTGEPRGRIDPLKEVHWGTICRFLGAAVAISAAVWFCGFYLYVLLFF